MSQDPFAPARDDLYEVRSQADGPAGSLPLTDELLRHAPSGTIFGLTQNVGMGADPARSNDPGVLILSTQGGMRNSDGSPAALGYHTGHYELGTIASTVAGDLTDRGFLPFAGFVSDPCDGRSQGTTAMFDSLPYRNDAAIVMRRLIRSLPHRVGVVGIATCDKGLPAMMMALAGSPDVPSVLIPGGVTLPPARGEDAGTVQTLGARYAHGLISLEDAAALGCAACASSGGGCQFLGTAATAQVVGEALGLAVGHTALAPSGEPVWLEGGLRAVSALAGAVERGQQAKDVLTDDSVRNAMVVHAAFGGSTNLLLHVPAIAHAAGLRRPTAADWLSVARETPRIVSVLPNGPVQHPTVRVYLAGGVPEVMLHLRRLGLLAEDVRVVEGTTLGERLDAWEASERRRRFRAILAGRGFDPDEVIFSPDRAAEIGMRGTVAFPTGNLAPHGSVVKATAIDAIVGGQGRRLRAHRPGAGLHVRARRDRGDQGRYGPGRRGDRPGRLWTGRDRDGGDLPAHLGAEARSVRPPGRADHGRPVLGCLHRRLYRPRRAGGAGRRPARQAADRRPGPGPGRHGSADRVGRLRRPSGR